MLRLDNVDCFKYDNFITENFISLEKCINTCKKNTINVFIILWENKKVYYRKQDIKSCIENLTYDKGSSLFICNYFETHYYLNFPNIPERISLYAKGLNKKLEFINQSEIDSDYSFSINKFNEWVNDPKNKKDRLQEHYKNMLKFIEFSKFDEKDFEILCNPYDLSWSLHLPTLTKSRVLKNPKNSILLPLEDLYIPSHYAYILNEDIKYEDKKDTCVWRGANSGNFFTECDKRPNRKDLILKYRFNDEYNIGLSYANYKTKRNIEYDPEKYVRDILSIKDQLKYRYIISLEGNDIATNLAWILLSNSVPIMAAPFIESWRMESQLIPFVHYVPLKNNYSDLDEKMEWCKKNQSKCKQIAYMSKIYALQFFDNEKEENICKGIIKKYISSMKNLPRKISIS